MAELSVMTLRQALAQESERGAVVTAANFLTEVLKLRLQSHFRHQKPGKELLQEANAPLASLSAVAKLCRALDLVTAGDFKRMLALRQVRNAFAHGWDDVTLGSAALRKPMKELGAAAANLDGFNEAVTALAESLLETG